MAAFDFPSSPNNGDTYSANGIDWIYNGSVWKKDATAGVKGQKGEVGVTGDKGQKGEIGATGGTGGTGSQGDKGQKGEVGAAATKGQKGEIGTTGTVFTSGTRMLFQQTTAPTGWTKDSSRNNRALRLVNGSVGDGGGNGFAEVLNSTVTTANGSVSNHTLTTAQLATHYHNVWTRNEIGIDGSRGGTGSSGQASGNWNRYVGYRQVHGSSDSYTPTSENTGSSNAHNHGFTNPSFNLNIAYTDVIIAQKD